MTDAQVPEIVQQENQSLTVVERLATNPEVDVEKLQKIMDMQEHALDRESERAYNADFVKAQADIRTVVRNQKNSQTHSRFADLNAVVQVAKPVWTAHGFALSFYEGEAKADGSIRVMCDIMHRDGHTKTRHTDFATDDKGIKGQVNKTPIHGKGSTFSYARRYLTCLIWHIPTGDDDDGNSSGTQEPAYVSVDQMNILSATLKECNVSEADLLKKLKQAKVSDDIPSIPASAFTRTLTTIRAMGKKSKIKGK